MFLLCTAKTNFTCGLEDFLDTRRWIHGGLSMPCWGHHHEEQTGTGTGACSTEHLAIQPLAIPLTEKNWWWQKWKYTHNQKRKTISVYNNSWHKLLLLVNSITWSSLPQTLNQLLKWTSAAGRLPKIWIKMSSFDLKEYTDVLGENAERAFESCQIRSNEVFIFTESYEYFFLRYSDGFDLIANGILWKIGAKIIINFPVNLYLIRETLSTSKGSYSVFP